MKHNVIKIALLSFFAAHTIMAAGPINFGQSTIVKRLKRSVENPVDLYKSTNAQHNNKLFTVRVISRLEQGGLPASEQAALRNEICASQKIQTANNASTFAQTPGAFGVYKHNESIVAVQDQGLMGERLDAVLRKLSTYAPATKVAIAASYALEMRRVLNAIHSADVTWNNLSLGNFYVRPDGSFTAVDFSTAKNSPGGVDTLDKKNERKNFLAHVVRGMYEILFPASGEVNADEPYAQFVGLAGVGAGWQALDLTQVNFNNIAAGAAPPTAYIPATDGPIAGLTGVLRAEHDATGLAANHGANGFVAHPDVIALLQAAPGAPAWADLNAACAAW